MSDRYNDDPASDLPWHDVPADSDVVPGTDEPDPAEVEGDEGEEHDVSRPPVREPRDEYRRETLDERLAEEVPDRISPEQDPEAPEIEAAENGEDDISLDEAEPDDEDVDKPDLPAEEAAVHIRSDDRI